MSEAPSSPSDFIREMIRADVAAGKHQGRVVTRFPPEPNGYLHIGHAKSICLNFGVAKEFGGRCHLRMDDTNPTTEHLEYVEAIKRDVRWLGFDWAEHMYFASDYYEQLYEFAEKLIRLGRAYVCELSEDQFADYRGTITQPGRESPFRNRPVRENIELFRRMRKGEFKDGDMVLRAKIDMASPNMKMRDPPIFRIKHAHHYRTGDTWCIYPLYDFAHCLSDSIEGITHSLCTLEFESARELYDWVIQAAEVAHVPRQTEFARLNLTHTIMSKRKLLQLVEGKHVNGWDDPRLPTLAGLRRRGYTPEAIREFCNKIGVAKNLSTVDVALLEHTLREDLNVRSPRVLCVLRPLKVVVENYPQGEVEQFDAPFWPHDVPKEGTRKVPFCRELYVDRDDFAENPPKDFYRLAVGREVRLRHAYIVRCTDFTKDEHGEVVEVRCTYDPATRGGVSTSGKKVEGTIHWVSASHALDVEVRLYDRLFSVENPGEDGRDFLDDLNPNSLSVVRAKAEPGLREAKPGEHYQFERTGFFFTDPDSKPGAPVFSRTVALKDSWAKVVSRQSRPENPPVAPKTRPKAEPAVKPLVTELGEAASSLRDAYGLMDEESRVLSQDPTLKSLFEQAVGSTGGKERARAVATLLVNEVLGELRARKLDPPPFKGTAVLELVGFIQEGLISMAQAKEVLASMFQTGRSPKAIVEEKGLRQIGSEAELLPYVDEVLSKNADAVARYRSGNANVLGALVGMVMKQTKGRANAKLVTEMLKNRLG